MSTIKPSALDRKKKDEEASKKERQKRLGHTHRVKHFTKGSRD